MNPTAEQKIHTIFPWVGAQVRVTYDKHTTHTANCNGIPQFTDVVEGRLLGVSIRLGVYQRGGGFVHDLVILTEARGLVTVSLAKTLTINDA